MLRVSITNFSVSCVFLALLLASGCSEPVEPVGSVSGEITLNGKGYSDCKVAIYCSVSSLPLGGRVGPDGAYEIKNVPVGSYAFMVKPIPIEQPENGGADPPDTSPIPREYRFRETTEFSVDIVADEVTRFDVELLK